MELLAGEGVRRWQRRVLLFALVSWAWTPARASETPPFALIGDAGKWNDSAKSVRDSIRDEGVRHLVLPGDNLYEKKDGYAGVWDHWSRHDLLFSVVAIGNHHGGYPAEARFFGMPGEYYSRDVGHARFLVLNSDNVTTAQEQSGWLDRMLGEPWEGERFVVFHHPPVTLSDKHPWSEREAFHLAVLPVILSHRDRITALLVGHDHIASLHTVDGIPLVVSGAVMEMRDGERSDYDRDDGISVRTLWMYRKDPHWIRMDVEEGEVSFEFIRAAGNRVQCRASIRGGELSLDPSCDFSAKEPSLQVTLR